MEEKGRLFFNIVALEEAERATGTAVYYPLIRTDGENLLFLDRKTIKDFDTFDTFVKGSKNKNPPFPILSLTERLEKYAINVAESLQVTIDMISSLELAVVALSVQNKFIAIPKPDWKEPLNLYVVVVGKPSERKSPTIKEATAPVHEYERMENERRKPKIAKYIAAKKLITKQIEKLENAAAGKGNTKGAPGLDDILKKRAELESLEEVRPLRLIADNTTPEALIKLMAENDGCIAVISSEGGIFDIMAGLYSNGAINIDAFTKAYSGDPIRIDRATKQGETVDNPALTMLLTVQPTVLTDAIENRAFRGRGLMARFLYSYPCSAVGHRRFKTQPVSKEARYMYDNLIQRLLAIPVPEEPMPIRFSKEAQDVLEEYFYDIEKRLSSDLEEIEDWAGKLVGQTVRIAALLHITEYIEKSAAYEVSADIMKRAIDIGNYYLEHALYVFDTCEILDAKEVRDAKYILKRWESAKVSKVSKGVSCVKTTARDTYQLCKGHLKSMDEMRPALKELERRGYIRMVEASTGGRPTETIYFNPEYLETLEMNKEVLQCM